MKTTKMEADFKFVTEYMQKNPSATKQQAIAVVAEKTGRSQHTVTTAYYRAAKKNGATLSKTGRKPKAVIAKAKTTKRTKITTPNHDLNVLRATLKDALKTIDILEAENKRNAKIVDDLRSVLA